VFLREGFQELQVAGYVSINSIPHVDNIHLQLATCLAKTLSPLLCPKMGSPVHDVRRCSVILVNLNQEERLHRIPNGKVPQNVEAQ